MQNIKKILLIIIIINSYCILNSQTAVKVPDATAQRGVMTLIDVVGTIDFDNTGELSFYFSFPGYLYDIKSIKANAGFAVHSLSQDGFKVIFNAYGLSKLIVKTNDYSKITNGTLFQIELEGLAYKDSIGYLTPDSVQLAGTKLNNTLLQEGKIIVPGLPVFDEFGEGLSWCYPNPFNYSVRIPFFLESEQKVKLVIYSLEGSRIPIHDINTETNRLFKKESNGNTVTIDNVYSALAPGYYEYLFTPDRWKMSNGAYYVFLIVGDKVYSKGLIYEKP